MLNAVSNPIDATPTAAGEPTSSGCSPLSELFNNPLGSSGQPGFAQVVHDAMNKTPDNASVPPNEPSTATESVVAAVPAQSPSSGTSSKANSTKSSSVLKQISQYAPQLAPPSANNLPCLSQLLPPAFSLTAAVPVPQTQLASTLASADSENSTDDSSVISASDHPPLPSPLSSNAAAHLVARLALPSASLAAIDPQSSIDPDIASIVDAGAPTPSHSTSSAALSHGSPSVTSASPSNNAEASNASAQPFAPQAASVAAISAPLSSLFGPNFLFPDAPPAQLKGTHERASDIVGGASSALTATAPVAPALTQQKPNALPQSAPSSPHAEQSGTFSKLVDQVAALQSAVSAISSAPVLTTEFSPSSQPSTVSRETDAAINNSQLPHSLSISAATVVSSAESKQTQSALLESHPANPAQVLTSVANQYSSSRDSSFNPGNQSYSNSSSAAASSAAQPLPSKNQSTDFSAQLANLTVPKADPAAAPAASPSSSPIVSAASIPPQQLDVNPHSSQQSLPSAPAQAQPTLPSVHSPDSSWGHQVSDAQFSNLNGQSEMRIAMQNDKLGAIELHARVTGDELGAAITVEKHDAHAALAIELPALQQSLSEKQLRVTQVALTQGSLSSTIGDAGAHSQQNQRGTPQSAQSPQSTQSNSFWNDARTLSTAAWFVHEQVGVFNAQGRLSVQA